MNGLTVHYLVRVRLNGLHDEVFGKKMVCISKLFGKKLVASFPNTIDVGYKHTGYKNISDISTPVIRTYRL